MSRPRDDRRAPDPPSPHDAAGTSRRGHGYQAVQDRAFALFLQHALHEGLDPQLDAPIPAALRRLIEDHAAPRR